MKKLMIAFLALGLAACAKPVDVPQQPVADKPGNGCTVIEDLRSTEQMIRLSCPIGSDICEMRKYPHITLLLCPLFSNWMDGGYETEAAK